MFCHKCLAAHVKIPPRWNFYTTFALRCRVSLHGYACMSKVRYEEAGVGASYTVDGNMGQSYALHKAQWTPEYNETNTHRWWAYDTLGLVVLHYALQSSKASVGWACHLITRIWYRQAKVIWWIGFCNQDFGNVRAEENDYGLKNWSIRTNALY
jgi:hypothetical protein